MIFTEIDQEAACCATVLTDRIPYLSGSEGLDGLLELDTSLTISVHERRASASICANLAEDGARDGDVELARFCSIVRGAASELQYQLLLARDLDFIGPSTHDKLTSETAESRGCSFKS